MSLYYRDSETGASGFSPQNCEESNQSNANLDQEDYPLVSFGHRPTAQKPDGGKYEGSEIIIQENKRCQIIKKWEKGSASKETRNDLGYQCMTPVMVGDLAKQ